jgi:hypothetical protein
MELIKQILASFADTLPNDSKTAAAIARGAGPEEISACASEEGLHALAGALFEASQEGGGQGGLPLDSTASVTGALAGRLKEFRQQLPACPGAALDCRRVVEFQAFFEIGGLLPPARVTSHRAAD